MGSWFMSDNLLFMVNIANYCISVMGMIELNVYKSVELMQLSEYIDN